MNISELKEDFYKRYGNVDKFLYAEECGMLCTLLGFSECEKTSSLNTMLYPNVTAVGCADNSTKITITKTSGTEEVVQPTKSKGAKILFHSDIPPSFNSRISEELCIEHLLKKINDKTDKVLSDKYFSKRGYCTKNADNHSKQYPLPIIGYNLVNVYFKEEKNFFKIDKLAEKSFENINKIIPDINTLSELSENDLHHLSCKIDNFEILNFLRFICEENERIETACDRLLKLDIDTLFSQLIISAKAMNIYFNIPQLLKDLFGVVSVTPAIEAYRYTSTGMLFFVSEDEVDYTINTIRNDFMAKYGVWLNFCISGM